MADSSRNFQDLIQELGFAPDEQGFLFRLFGSSDPFAELSEADIETSRTHDQSSRRSTTNIAQRFTSFRLRHAIIPILTRRS